MKGGAFKMITSAALVGLVVLNAGAFAKLVERSVATFREAVKLA